MTSCDEIKQTVERILNLTADHINVGDGKLRFNIIGIVSSGGTHLTHVRIGGTGQQQRFRTLAGGTLNPSKFKDGDSLSGWVMDNFTGLLLASVMLIGIVMAANSVAKKLFGGE